MDYNYKVIVFGNGIYREAPLEIKEDAFRIGVQKNCDIRFDKTTFFEEITIALECYDGDWRLNCGSNIYIDRDGIVKLQSVNLQHGDVITLRYKKSKAELFKIYFVIDFDAQDYNFDRIVDLSSKSQITIGENENCDIYLCNQFAGGDTMTLIKQNGVFYLVDNNTRNGVYVNGTRVEQQTTMLNEGDFFMLNGSYFYLRENKIYTSMNDYKIINGMPYADVVESKSQFQYPNFERSVRVQRIINGDVIEILNPKPAPQKDKTNFFMNILPSIISLLLMIVIRGSMARNKMFIVYSASVMAMGVIVSIISFKMNGKQYKEELEKREKEYTDYINKKEQYIQSERKKEIAILEQTYSTSREEIQQVFDFSPRLFEKSVQDADFLSVRLGTGTLRSMRKIVYQEQEFHDKSDELMTYPEKLATEYEYIENVPISLDLKKCNAVGFLGKSQEQYDLLKIITIDLAVSHYFENVAFFYMFNPDDIEKFKKLRWLKNVTNDRSTTRNFMYSEDSKKHLLESLYKTITTREMELEKPDATIDSYQQIVVFVMDGEAIRKHPISNYFGKAASLNFRFIFFEEFKEYMPMACDRLIYLDNSMGDHKGVIVDTHEGDLKQSFVYDPVSDDVLEKMVLKLGTVDVTKASLESELHNITLFEMLDIMQIDDLDLGERWKNSKVYETMEAPLGIRGNGSIVYLDLSDKKHGPHGLVAGTTGSGKSEIIQTYILSMATLFHPYDVGFMIIDFKGGGMANQFKDLPHLMGTITNIDGREINRSLLAIKAELIKRQEIFSEAGVNNISDYIRKFKKGEVTIPMPHLIMVCDEFAELKAEYPDFMKEIVSAARIGRTLGVHLILATQKPAGVVDNQIWSNSKFKLCLKVQTREDSNEVLKSPLASEIKEPGRAYLQVGNNEIFELFQSAYSGAKASNSLEAEKTFQLYEVNLWGNKKLVFSNKKKGNEGEQITQLDAVIKYVNEYCVNQAIARLKGICMPPLKDVMYMNEVSKVQGKLAEGICANIGIYDDPEQQTQAPLCLNFSENNTYIAGASQMGKTTLLQTIIYNLMNTYSPAELNMYLIDFGNMALKIFEEANHVGGVVLTSDSEKLVNLFKMLLDIIEKRKEIFAEKGLGTFGAYVEAGFDDLPQILVFIDNVAVFREQYADYYDTLISLSREGRSVGINFVVTGTQANSFGFKALANYGSRLALFCTEKAEYSNLFSRCRMEPKETPGRGLCIIDKSVKEFQTALAFEGNKEIERVENMRRFILENSQKYSGMRAKPIPVVPKTLSEKGLRASHAYLYEDVSKLPYAMDYATVEYRYLDFMSNSMLTVSGAEGMGKTNMTRLVLNHLKQNLFDFPSKVFILDNDENELGAYENEKMIKGYATDITMLPDYIANVEEIMLERQDRVTVNGRNSIDWTKEPEIVLIINSPVAMAELTKKKDLATKLAGFVKNYKKFKFLLILANADNATIAFNANDIMKYVKETKSAIVFEEIDNIKIMDITPKIVRAFGRGVGVGDAYEFAGNAVAKLKTIHAEIVQND